MAFTEQVTGLVGDHRDDLLDAAGDIVGQDIGVVVCDPIAIANRLRDTGKGPVPIECIGRTDVDDRPVTHVFREGNCENHIVIRAEFVQ